MNANENTCLITPEHFLQIIKNSRFHFLLHIHLPSIAFQFFLDDQVNLNRRFQSKEKFNQVDFQWTLIEWVFTVNLYKISNTF